MRRKRIDSQVERHILVAMIMSKEFLSSAAGVLDINLIEADHFRQIASWCLNYFTEYGEAPKHHIENIFHSWSESKETESEYTDTIHSFLEALSGEYDAAMDINVPYLLDELKGFLASRKLRKLQEDLDYSMSEGKTSDAEDIVLGYKSVEIGSGAGVDLLNDEDAWIRAFSEPSKPLMKFGGDAGKFLNAALTRDSLIGIQAPEKRGKTWWCVEFLMRALRNRKKVALFEVGDLSESQISLRLGVRISGRPLRKDLCGDVRVPVSISREEEENDDGDTNYTTCMEYDDRELYKPVTKNDCIKSCQKFMRRLKIPTDKPYMMVSVHPNSSINVRGISAILDRWASERDFIPDVIIIDYADILAPEDTTKQARDQVNDTWKALRRLSQERHSLVIAPTQADAASYDSKTQTMKNFSEDKRKLSHVTGMLGLNQSPEEKDSDIMRLNWLVLRESPFNPNQCLYVGNCFTIGKALCCATL